jgi:hypothetical protein
MNNIQPIAHLRQIAAKLAGFSGGMSGHSQTLRLLYRRPALMFFQSSCCVNIAGIYC